MIKSPTAIRPAGLTSSLGFFNNNPQGLRHASSLTSVISSKPLKLVHHLRFQFKLTGKFSSFGIWITPQVMVFQNAKLEKQQSYLIL